MIYKIVMQNGHISALRELNLDAMSSPRALWWIPIRHKALRELKIKNRHE
jgi:hypothetical protein